MTADEDDGGDEQLDDRAGHWLAFSSQRSAFSIG
jgi:hypothetical protein